jgi:hypothetical protein
VFWAGCGLIGLVGYERLIVGYVSLVWVRVKSVGGRWEAATAFGGTSRMT